MEKGWNKGAVVAVVAILILAVVVIVSLIVPKPISFSPASGVSGGVASCPGWMENQVYFEHSMEVSVMNVRQVVNLLNEIINNHSLNYLQNFTCPAGCVKNRSLLRFHPPFSDFTINPTQVYSTYNNNLSTPGTFVAPAGWNLSWNTGQGDLAGGQMNFAGFTRFQSDGSSNLSREISDVISLANYFLNLHSLSSAGVCPRGYTKLVFGPVLLRDAPFGMLNGAYVTTPCASYLSGGVVNYFCAAYIQRSAYCINGTVDISVGRDADYGCF